MKYLDGILEHGGHAAVPAADVRDVGAAARPVAGRRTSGRSRPGSETLADYERTVRAAAREALDALERENRLGIVLLGRPYHHDPGLNHGIPEELQKLGYAVFSQSTLPLDEDLLDRLFGDEVRAGVISHPLDIQDVWKHSFAASSNLKIWAAKFAARHPNLVAVELSNFKCGHDAPIYATIEEIIETSGTPYFGFKDIDENKPAGAIKLRLETIDYSLKRAREELLDKGRRAERIEKWLAAYEQRLRRQLDADAGPGPTRRDTHPAAAVSVEVRSRRVGRRHSRAVLQAWRPAPDLLVACRLRSLRPADRLGHDLAGLRTLPPMWPQPVDPLGHVASPRWRRPSRSSSCSGRSPCASWRDMSPGSARWPSPCRRRGRLRDAAGAGARRQPLQGALYGLFPIGWIVVAAVFLYRVTVETGQFEVIKQSVASLTDDRRLQALLIAFSFGAFLEGAAGFGTPVAISAAMLVGLGLRAALRGGPLPDRQHRARSRSAPSARRSSWPAR